VNISYNCPEVAILIACLECLAQKKIKATSKAFNAGEILPSEHPVIAAADFMGGKAYTHMPE
jgi:hypothetical protein